MRSIRCDRTSRFRARSLGRVLLAAATLLLAAHMFRYAPAGDGFYWDRWKHRECEAVDGTLDCTGVPPRVQAQPVAGG